MKALFDWSVTCTPFFFFVDWLAPYLIQGFSFFLSMMDNLSLPFEGDGSGASSSKRPRFNLNLPPAEPEPASTSDPREEEEENLRLREENARLIHMYGAAAPRKACRSGAPTPRGPTPRSKSPTSGFHKAKEF